MASEPNVTWITRQWRLFESTGLSSRAENSAWVTQQARNLTWQVEDEGLKLSLVIHDHHREFPGSFDRIFRSDGSRNAALRDLDYRP